MFLPRAIRGRQRRSAGTGVQLKLERRKATVKRHSTDELNSLLDRFTVEQLHDLAAAVAPGKDVGRARQKADLISKLLRLGTTKRIALAAHRLETLIPFKHLYLHSFVCPPALAKFDNFVRKFAENSGGLLDDFVPVDLKDTSLKPQIAVVDPKNQRLYLKFVHAVEHAEWLTTDDRTKELFKYRERHPVVLTLRSRDSIATVTFPGYTQGSGTPVFSRLEYDSIASSAVSIASDLTGAEFTGYYLKPVVDFLVNRPDSEVVDVGRSLRSAEGKAELTSGEASTDVATFLSKIVGARVAPSEMRELLANQETYGVALLWRRLRVFTRIHLKGGAPEILFIWKGSDPSLSTIEYVLQKLLEPGPAQPVGEAEIRGYLGGLGLGERILASGLVQKFGLPDALALRVLTDEVSKGHLELRFRVKSSLILQDYINDWRRSASELPESVTDEHGMEIDVSDPSNVEVSYERV